MRRLLHVALTRARKGLVLAWAEAGAPGTTPRPSPFYEEARAALDLEEEAFEEELFGPGRGAALHVPDHARRAARHRRARGRAAGRDAPRHLPGRGPGGRALPRADQGCRADRARPRGPDARHRAARGQRDPRPVRHARAARDLRGVRARLAGCATPAATRPSARPARQNGADALARPVHPAPRPGADAVGVGHRHLPDLPAQVQVRARLPDPAGADHQPALRHRHAPGAGALPHRGRRLARAPARAVRDLLAALGLRRLRRRAAVPRARGRALERYWRQNEASERRAGLVRALASRSSSARTCCAGASTASTATRTARSS